MSGKYGMINKRESLYGGGNIMRVLMFFIALLCFVTAGILEITNIPGILALIVGLVALRFAFRGKKFKPKVVVSSGNEELDKLNTELFKRAVEDFNTLEREMKTLNDKELRKQVGKMQGIAKNFLTYLQSHPERISLARRFVDYYQDRAILLVQKYKELEQTGLDAAEVQQSKVQIKGLLNNFDEAYADQFSKVLNAQLMDLDAEMKVMKDNMAADGLKPEIPEGRKIPERNNDLVNSIIDLTDKFLNTKRK